MDTNVWSYPWDLYEQRHLDYIKNDLEITGVNLATIYHSVQHLSFRRNIPQIFEGDSGAFFNSDSNFYSDIELNTSSLSKEVDFDGLVSRIRSTGLNLNAWIVATHNSILSSKYPEARIKNAINYPFSFSVCPNNPRVRIYLKEMVKEVSQRFKPNKIILEALHWNPFPHHKHNKLGIPISSYNQLMLSLCFCDSCIESAQKFNIDALKLKKEIIGQISAMGKQNSFKENISSELKQYLLFREKSLTKLVEEISKITNSKLQIVTTDSTEISGLNHENILKFVDKIIVLAYSSKSSFLQEKLNTHSEELQADKLSVGLGSCYPWAPEAETLKNNIEVARNNNVTDLSFYHYGMMTEENLTWLKKSLNNV